MKKIIILLLSLIFISCASKEYTVNAYIIKYEDFGPPVIARNLIGMDWWQWQNHGDSRPKKYDIKVVVYKNIDLEKIKILYPIVPLKNQDYRYVNYRDALKYLDKYVADNVIEAVTNKLTDTRNKIINSVGNN